MLRSDLIKRFTRRAPNRQHDLYLSTRTKEILRLDNDFKDVCLSWLRPECVVLCPRDVDLYLLRESLLGVVEDIDYILRNSTG
jgi:hypothetical protein